MIGKTLGQYQIIEEIGRGGMAIVYKAFQPAMNRIVALKVLPQLLATNETAIKRFAREMQTVALLEHPHIIPVYDAGTDSGYHYLAMRYLDGGSLKDLISSGPISPLQAANIVEQVSSALDYAHGQGIVHRDVKPANIMIDKQGWVYLTDFGIAKVMENTADMSSITGGAIGTPSYMAPEQILGEPVDRRTDVYALGIVLYEMLTGRVPFQATTPMAAAFAHVQREVPLPSSVNAAIPTSLDRIILKALAKAPDARFQSAGDLSLALSDEVTDQHDRQQSPRIHPKPASPHFSEAAKTFDELGETIVSPPSPAPATTRPANPAQSSQGKSSLPWLLAAIGVIGLVFILAVSGAFHVSRQQPISSSSRSSAPVVNSTARPSETPYGEARGSQFEGPGPGDEDADSPQAQPTPTAKPMATESRASSPTFSNIRFFTSSGSSSATTSFPEGATNIYMKVDYAGMTRGTRYSREWLSDGDLWIRYEDCVWTGAASGTQSVELREPGGLYSGEWEVIIRDEDGRVMARATLTVRGNHTYWDPVGSVSCDGYQ